MPKTDKKTSDADSVTGPAGNAGNHSSADSGGVDKIRELIFGTQMQDYEKKFAIQEESFTVKLNQLRDDTKNWFDTLEKFVKDELESLSDQLKKEKRERTEDDREAMKKLDQTGASLQKTIDRLAEQTKNDEKDLRRQLLDQSKQLRTELQQSGDTILQKLEQGVNALRDEKADRRNLSLLLMEVALQLNHDVTVEDLEKLRNG